MIDSLDIADRDRPDKRVRSDDVWTEAALQSADQEQQAGNNDSGSTANGAQN